MAIERSRKLRELSEKELNDKMKELRLELSKDRAGSEIGTVKNPGRIKEVRKTIAKILTILTERKKKVDKK